MVESTEGPECVAAVSVRIPDARQNSAMKIAGMIEVPRFPKLLRLTMVLLFEM